jgi:hypothetical protein
MSRIILIASNFLFCLLDNSIPMAIGCWRSDFNYSVAKFQNDCV